MSDANPAEAQRRAILVIGGASGIGRAVCRQLRSDAVKLIVADKDEAALVALETELGAAVETHVFDFTDAEAVAACLAAIRAGTGALDAAVVSAAAHATHPAEFLPDALIDRVIDINLVAHIKLVRDLLPVMKDGGRIVGISSNCADIGIPMETVYAASKAGLERFYEGLSIEISYRGIKPIVIHPGNVNTGFNERGNDYRPSGNAFVDDAYGRVVASIDSKNGIDPAIVARTVVRAIDAKRPRFRYIVGKNALKAHWAKRLLGTDLALKVLASYFGFRFNY